MSKHWWKLHHGQNTKQDKYKDIMVDLLDARPTVSQQVWIYILNVGLYTEDC